MAQAHTGRGVGFHQARDTIGRTIDYLFGRNALLGLASFLLLLISGFATWSGMRDFIIGVAGTVEKRSIGNGISVSDDLIVASVVIALTFLMWIALRETFGAQRSVGARMVTAPLYVFLALWSIGFGYGFWWSLIAGNEATRTGLAGLEADARDASTVIVARLDAVRSQIDSVATWSDSQMSREEASGGSCGTSSGAGRGPLYNARRTVRDQVASLKETVNGKWLGPLSADVEKLKAVAQVPAGGTVEERQRAFEAKAEEIRGEARSIAARSAELGKSTAADMRALAEAVSIEPNKPGFSCYDPTLASRLRQAAEQADQPPALTLREAAFSEGPAGVANAIKRLWTNIGAYSGGLGGFVMRGFRVDPAAAAAVAGQGISGRDMIALLATLGIDLGLLVLAILEPPASGPVRRDGLAATQARLHLPPASVIRQLTSALETAIARAPGADLEWVRKHFLHHNGASYMVIPNVYSVEHEEEGSAKGEEQRALAMNQLAGVLVDLGLVRALGQKDFEAILKDEERNSMSDLSAIRSKRAQQTSMSEEERAKWQKSWSGRVNQTVGALPIRNHGLLSKAQRVLDIAGWSEKAQQDIEVFRIIDQHGLTPLLTLLNEATLAKGAESALAAHQERTQGLVSPAAPTGIEVQKPLQIADGRNPTNTPGRA